jgi:hypothetical protein
MDAARLLTKSYMKYNGKDPTDIPPRLQITVCYLDFLSSNCKSYLLIIGAAAVCIERISCS